MYRYQQLAQSHLLEEGTVCWSYILVPYTTGRSSYYMYCNQYRYRYSFTGTSTVPVRVQLYLQLYYSCIVQLYRYSYLDRLERYSCTTYYYGCIDKYHSTAVPSYYT